MSFRSISDDSQAAVARQSVPSNVVDIFSGCGALSYGFRAEGFNVTHGIDIDETCRFPYETNVEAPLICADVRDMTEHDVVRGHAKGQPTILVGCAPCQPFSSYARQKRHGNWGLIKEFERLVLSTNPHVVTMENVPRLMSFQRGKVFNAFTSRLKQAGYDVNWGVVYCPNFGIAQTRSRLVLLASRLGGVPELPTATLSPTEYRCVRDVIGDLPSLQAGQTDTNDPLHVACRLSPLNLKRIRASIPGGTWQDWDPSLLANCHRSVTGSSFKSVYGRMEWDRPSPTLTTQFYGYGHGRFGHPVQDRALSLREGADLQSFPRNFRFVPEGTRPSTRTIGRQIGNAVPIGLARAIARTIASHLKEMY